MHIPDGYLSPQTSIPMLIAMGPLWSLAIKKIKSTFDLRQIPVLALCSAFSFIIMMFNVPFGVNSVHAIGAVLIAILLGPWAACISVTIALIIQAVFFADGGILAIGVNCFNMAFAMPFSGYMVYRLIAGKSELHTKRGMIGVALGSYVGINVCALLAAIELGIQPLLFKDANGVPLYGFIPLKVTIPTMMGQNILVTGPIEALITIVSLIYISKYSKELYDKLIHARTEGIMENSTKSVENSFFKRYKAIFIAFIALILLTPLGLISTGTAFGEWSTEEVSSKIGYVPSLLSKFSNLWGGILPGYSVNGLNNGFFQSAIGYIISAVMGISVITLVLFISSKLINKESTGGKSG